MENLKTGVSLGWNAVRNEKYRKWEESSGYVPEKPE
jgi:hypothetical protein